jgi:hypothetical protein
MGERLVLKMTIGDVRIFESGFKRAMIKEVSRIGGRSVPLVEVYESDNRAPYDEYGYWAHAYVSHNCAAPLTKGQNFGIHVVVDNNQEIEFEINKNVLGVRKPTNSPLAPSTIFALNTYCYTDSDVLQLCRTNKGSYFIELQTLAKQASGATDNAKICDSHAAGLVTGELSYSYSWHSVDSTGKKTPLTKSPLDLGLIVFARDGAERGGDEDWRVFVNADLSPYLKMASSSSGDLPLYNTLAEHGKIESTLHRLREESLDIYRYVTYSGVALRPAMPYLKMVHCPSFDTDFANLPGAAYSLLSSLLPTRGRSLHHLLTQALVRMEMSGSDFAATVNATLSETKSQAKVSLDFFKACSVLATFLSIIATASPYVSDIAKVPGTKSHVLDVENFKQPRVDNQDCEGDAVEINVLYKEVVQLDLTNNVESLSKSQISELQALKRLALLYVPLICLGAVTSASFSNKVSATSEDIIAHEFFVLMPRHEFSLRTRQLDSGAWVASQVESPFGVLNAFERAGSLPMLVCEGTGEVYPLQAPLAWYRDRCSDEVDWDSTLLAFRKIDKFQNRVNKTLFGKDENVKTISYPVSMTKEDMDQTPPRFYLYVNSAYVSYEPLLNMGVMDVTFGSTESMTYGVRFSDFVCMEPDAYQIFIDSNMDPHEVRIIQDVICQLEPIPPLRISRLETLDEGRLALHKKYDAYLRSKLRTLFPPGSKKTHADLHIRYNIRLEDIVTSELDALFALVPSQVEYITYEWQPLLYSANIPIGEGLEVLTLEIYFKNEVLPRQSLSTGKSLLGAPL